MNWKHLLTLQLYWIPIRDWNSLQIQGLSGVTCCNYIESLLGIETVAWTRTSPEIAESCNYIESLLGIETKSAAENISGFSRCNYIESLLGIETVNQGENIMGRKKLQLYWIPIRDWNKYVAKTVKLMYIKLQLYWIPIRDWNLDLLQYTGERIGGCNYIESLLGIETGKSYTFIVGL